jgi:hypothetical protein
MVRVAAIYDLHGNLPALEAVLDEIRQAAVDQVVAGGDVLPGPMPGEILDGLLGLDLPVEFICGNGEVAVLDEIGAGRRPGCPRAHRAAIRWTAEKVRRACAGLLAEWP